MSLFKTKKATLETNKKQLEESNLPSRKTKDLYKITVEKITRTYREKLEDKYYDLETKKEIGWSEYYNKKEADEAAKKVVTVTCIKAPSSEFATSDSSHDIYTQEFDNIYVENLITILNKSQANC